MPYTLPALPYGYDALEPHFDSKTMEIHHTKHHQTYIDKVNAALAGTEFEGKPVEEVIADLSKVPEDKRERSVITVEDTRTTRSSGRS